MDIKGYQGYQGYKEQGINYMSRESCFCCCTTSWSSACSEQASR